ncbi:MAG: rhomboid family intramembrane serine protease, partial [Bacteroidetes bacterium]|nr:rhomboid family intramembrane serine protease [Bacteroidota bacterium]
MKISYNSPVILSFTILSGLILILDLFFFAQSRAITYSAFTVDGSFQFTNPLAYITLFGHIFGHSGWQHWLSNFSFILLIGPLIEEKYGSKALMVMMLVTAFITAVLNIVFFETGLLGASGIVFMLILLSS